MISLLLPYNLKKFNLERAWNTFEYTLLAFEMTCNILCKTCDTVCNIFIIETFKQTHSPREENVIG